MEVALLKFTNLVIVGGGVVSLFVLFYSFITTHGPRRGPRRRDRDDAMLRSSGFIGRSPVLFHCDYPRPLGET